MPPLFGLALAFAPPLFELALLLGLVVGGSETATVSYTFCAVFVDKLTSSVVFSATGRKVIEEAGYVPLK